MSTFDDDEKSVQDAQPAELYTITTPTTTYRLTSYTQDITVASNTYSAAPINRDGAAVGKVGDGRELTISISLDHAVAQDLLVGGVPQREVLISLDRYMFRSGASRRLWKGYLSDTSADGKVFKMRVPELVDDYVAGVRLPSFSAMRLCQHGLYDAGCTMSESAGANRVTTTVTAISADGLTITVNGGTFVQPTGWSTYGKLTRVTDGEPRSILDQTTNVITVDVPFRTLLVGDSVNVNAGCDHTPTRCRDQFANIINYGGHPLLPIKNLMSPVRLGINPPPHDVNGTEKSGTE